MKIITLINSSFLAQWCSSSCKNKMPITENNYTHYIRGITVFSFGTQTQNKTVMLARINKFHSTLQTFKKIIR